MGDIDHRMMSRAGGDLFVGFQHRKFAFEWAKNTVGNTIRNFVGAVCPHAFRPHQIVISAVICVLLTSFNSFERPLMKTSIVLQAHFWGHYRKTTLKIFNNIFNKKDRLLEYCKN
jgi:hypothetical protein